MKEPHFTVKVYRGGVSEPASVEFYSTPTSRVVDLKNPENEFYTTKHSDVVSQGATHMIEVVIGYRQEPMFIFEKDVVFIESPQGATIFSINKR